ncbi:uncharacterized protein TNCV_848741 [Trichonephila clavipes]|uniref:Uncharacterized protein n=1 Tax=Trichonephila clavipes TaxID=2585209 RepID=A0A8X6RMG6_TRICX|nr:uncharacterized protein TNCV_848741 [Trichonephila clavipes]
MRRVSRRPELPMAPVQIPHVLEPVQIPLVPQPPVQIPQVPQPPVQIPQVPQPPVQIPQVPQPPLQIPPVQISDVPDPVQISVSQVPQPPVPFQDVPDPRQIPHVPNLGTLGRFHMFQTLCRFYMSQKLCRFPQSSTLWTLWSRRMHSTSSCRSYLDPQPKKSSCFTRYPLFLMNGFGTTLVGPVSTSTTIVFGNLGRWPNRVTYYETEYPYTIFLEPNFGVHVPRLLGKIVIVFTSPLDLTWDKGVDLKFFRVSRPPSRQVWKEYQPQNTKAYPLDLTHCT